MQQKSLFGAGGSNAAKSSSQSPNKNLGGQSGIKKNNNNDLFDDAPNFGSSQNNQGRTSVVSKVGTGNKKKDEYRDDLLDSVSSDERDSDDILTKAPVLNKPGNNNRPGTANKRPDDKSPYSNNSQSNSQYGAPVSGIKNEPYGSSNTRDNSGNQFSSSQPQRDVSGGRGNTNDYYDNKSSMNKSGNNRDSSWGNQDNSRNGG